MPIKSYGKILTINLRHNFRLPFAAAAGIVVLMPLLFNINSLQGIDAAKPIEFWLCFVGLILLVPVFWPEQDKDIMDVVCSKKIDYVSVCLIRLLYSAAAIAILIALSVGMMKLGESDVGARHVFGGIASAYFLGAVGFAAAGTTGNAAAGYMAALLYYLLNYGLKEKLGKFYLFPMSGGGGIRQSGWLTGGGVVLCALTLAVIKYRHKYPFLFIKYGKK